MYIVVAWTFWRLCIDVEFGVDGFGLCSAPELNSIVSAVECSQANASLLIQSMTALAEASVRDEVFRILLLAPTCRLSLTSFG